MDPIKKAEETSQLNYKVTNLEHQLATLSEHMVKKTEFRLVFEAPESHRRYDEELRIDIDQIQLRAFLRSELKGSIEKAKLKLYEHIAIK